MTHFKPIKNQNGVTLVELMVSIAIGLFILAGVMQLYLTSVQNSTMVSGSSGIQEDARYLFSKIESDVTKAGYAGCMNFNIDKTRIQNIAKQNTNPAFNARQFIEGENDVATNDKTFDRFVVSYAGSSQKIEVSKVQDDSFVVDANLSKHFAKGDIAVVGDCSGFGVFQVSNEPNNTGIIEFKEGNYNSASFSTKFSDSQGIAPGISYIYLGTGAFQYFVATSEAGIDDAKLCESATPQYCALYRLSSNDADPVELIDGVSEFEVEYGWRDAVTGNLFFADADAVPSADWANVDRIRINTSLNSAKKVATNQGMDYMATEFSRTFVFFNQIPEA